MTFIQSLRLPLPKITISQNRHIPFIIHTIVLDHHTHFVTTLPSLLFPRLPHPLRHHFPRLVDSHRPHIPFVTTSITASCHVVTPLCLTALHTSGDQISVQRRLGSWQEQTGKVMPEMYLAFARAAWVTLPVIPSSLSWCCLLPLSIGLEPMIQSQLCLDHRISIVTAYPSLLLPQITIFPSLLRS